jgi:hypothetical protein
MAYGAITAFFLPQTSEQGVHKRGPSPTPNKNNDIPSVPTSSEVLYCLSILEMAGEYLYEVSLDLKRREIIRTYAELAHAEP